MAEAHIAAGIKTNIVTAIEIAPSNVHDSPVMGLGNVDVVPCLAKIDLFGVFCSD